MNKKQKNKGQELEKIRKEIKEREKAWENNTKNNTDPIDPHFHPIDWTQNNFTPDANHHTNI